MIEHQRPRNRIAIAARTGGDLVVPSSRDDNDRPNAGILVILWRRRWIVLGCVLAALVSAYIYLLKAVPIYSSNSVVYVQQSIPKVLSDELTMGSNSAGYLFTQCQLIQSTAILSAALDKQGVSDARCLRGVDNPVAFLKSSIIATPGKQGDLITVTMESTDPQDASVIVNGVVEAFIDYQSKQHQSTAVEVLRILQKERDSHEADLKAAQDAIFAYKKKNPDIALDSEKGNIGLNSLNEFSEALTQAQLHQLDLQTANVEANIARNDPVELKRLIDRFKLLTSPDGETNPRESAGQQAMASYQQDRQHLSDLLDDYGPKFIEVQRTARRLGREEAQIAQETENIARTYGIVLQEALAASAQYVDELQKRVDQERKSVMDLSVKDAEFDQLEQQKERIDRAIDLLDSRMKEINVTEDVGALTVSVLEIAKPNPEPVRPRRAQTLGMGLVAGLMVGLGGALLRDMMDQRLRSAEEIAGLLELPILGAIPHMIGKAVGLERGQEIHLHPRSDVAEAYRTVRTAIYFGMADVNSAKTILVTSPAPGDGKTTLISNLAIAIAQAGRRVLLIDADCRRPMQHKIFKLAEGPGVSSVLAGKCDLEKALQKTQIEKLDILPCGPIPHNPAEILNSQAFLDLLAEVSKRYDQILIDSPPVMPVTDARILTASCDATVLVLRAEKSTRRLAEHARDALTAVGGSLIGVVVNDVPRGQSGYGYYYYGYGRYGYTYGNGKKNGNGKSNGNGHGDMPELEAIVASDVSPD